MLELLNAIQRSVGMSIMLQVRIDLLLDYYSIENGLTKEQARIMEQNLINKYGIIRNGGKLYNKINSISPKYWNKYGIERIVK